MPPKQKGGQDHSMNAMATSGETENIIADAEILSQAMLRNFLHVAIGTHSLKVLEKCFGAFAVGEVVDELVPVL
jgi:hypothetical protein